MEWLQVVNTSTFQAYEAFGASFGFLIRRADPKSISTENKSHYLYEITLFLPIDPPFFSSSALSNTQTEAMLGFDRGKKEDASRCISSILTRYHEHRPVT